MTNLNQTRALHTTLHEDRDLSFIWRDGPVTVLLGDVRARLAELDAESVQCVVTSPPYWGLRDYGTALWDGGDPECGHSVGDQVNQTIDRGSRRENAIAAGQRPGTDASRCRKCGAVRVDAQLGLEANPAEYVDAMVGVFEGVRRVLRKDGTLWLNLGDCYASSPPGRPNGEVGVTSGLHGAERLDGRYRETLKAGHGQKRNTIVAGLKPKDLVGMPWQVALALRAAGWYLRSDIIWSKPNPMPESVQDRPTKAHEYLFLLTRSERYYYDADAIRTPLTAKTLTTFGSVRHDPGDGSGLVKSENFGRDVPVRQPRMKMPDGWDTGAGDHGSFHRNGRQKGETKDKQRGHGRRHAGFNDRWDQMSREEQQYAGANARTVWEIATQAYPEAHFATFPEALVEPCVLAGSRQGDVVLDPFAGSGTTLAVARRLGRRAIGIELQPDYLPLIQRRVREAALPLVEVMDGLPEQSFSTLNEVKGMGA